jgi:quercetin dioxygenase-like cupin family protein
MTQPTQAELEANIIRFDTIGARKSPFRPRDMLLERFERERYSVIGRPAEGSTAGTALGDVKAFSMVYLRCEPGKGIGSHAHASAEVFVVMSGQWEIDVEGTRTTLNPFDVISVPPNLFHEARNISDAPAVMMALNEGQTGVPIHLDPALLAEIRASGHVVSDPEYPPGPGSARPA